MNGPQCTLARTQPAHILVTQEAKSEADNAAVRQFLNHPQTVGFAKRTDRNDRSHIQFAIDPRKHKSFLRPESLMLEFFESLQQFWHGMGKDSVLINFRDKFLFRVFAQTIRFVALGILIQDTIDYSQ